MPEFRPEFSLVMGTFDNVVSVIDPMYKRVETTVGIALPVIYNKVNELTRCSSTDSNDTYMGLFVAMMFLPAMACVIPFGIIAFTIGLPLFLPLAIVTGIIVLLNSLMLGLILLLSPPGRKNLLQPFVDSCHPEYYSRYLTAGRCLSGRCMLNLTRRNINAAKELKEQKKKA
eukprot:624082-Hanusia_phi.AAC.6